MESLAKKVVQGGYWVSSFRLLNRALGFLRTIILARLLLPQDFGLLGMAMLAIAVLDILSQTGFNQALVQKKDPSRSDLNTAWTLSAIRGFLLFAALFIASPLIAGFFRTPDVEALVKVVAVSVLIGGFRNIGTVFFQKDLQLRRQFFFELSGTATDFLISVGLAFLLENVWALVYGGLAGNVVRLLFSYILHDYRPRIECNRQSFHTLFSFGRWILLSGMVYAALTQIDVFVVGRVLGPLALGYYQMSLMIAYLPSTELSSIVTQVMFPAYSMLQDDKEKLQRAYLGILQLTAFIVAPLYGFILLAAPEIVTLILGAKWRPIAPILQILCGSGMLVTMTYTTIPVFQAVRKPAVESILQFSNLSVIALAIYPLVTGYGLRGCRGSGPVRKHRALPGKPLQTQDPHCRTGMANRQADRHPHLQYADLRRYPLHACRTDRRGDMAFVHCLCGPVRFLIRPALPCLRQVLQLRHAQSDKRFDQMTGILRDTTSWTSAR